MILESEKNRKKAKKHFLKAAETELKNVKNVIGNLKYNAFAVESKSLKNLEDLHSKIGELVLEIQFSK